MYVITYLSPLGAIYIVEEEGFIKEIGFGAAPKELSYKETELLMEARRQLEAYFAGRLKAFDLPLTVEGTTFQLSVWAALQAIPYGETRSYQDIARAVGSEKAVRAVGGANHRNKLAIVIPCHRVIGKSGALVGYAGGMDFKKALLELEKHHA